MLSSVDILGPNGRIAARLEHYEQRSEQLAMADAVAAAIAEKRHLLVEAGTGVGKSFAYLVPAILATAEKPAPRPTAANGKPGNSEEEEDDAEGIRRVVISTHTISLQEQLMAKDLPLLRAVMPIEFTSVLVKGRGNYLSLRRMNSAVERARSLFYDESEIEQLRDVVAWSKTTKDGSLSDMSFRPLPQVWDETKSDSTNCMGRKCPTYKECYYYMARRRASNAQILVVNHALYFSDLALRRVGASILPNHDIVIFDEAHTLEQVAGDHMGLSVTSGQIEFTLNRLYNDRSNRGLLVAYRLGDAQKVVMECRHRADEFFRDLETWLERRGKSNGRVREPEIVKNLLSPALDKLAKMVRRHGAPLKDEERQDFT
jgi:ATP-dependent DNA helicase DinG